MLYRDDLDSDRAIARMTTDERLDMLRELFLLGLPPRVVLAIAAAIIFIKKM